MARERTTLPNHLDDAGCLNLGVAREQWQRQLLCGSNDQRIERVAVKSQLVGGDDLLARQVEGLVGRVGEEDFLDLRAFAAHDVRFLIVGAYALAIHGRPRATGDLDVWIDATDGNAARVYAALRSFGAPLGDVSERDFARPGIVFQIGVVPGALMF